MPIRWRVSDLSAGCSETKSEFGQKLVERHECHAKIILVGLGHAVRARIENAHAETARAPRHRLADISLAANKTDHLVPDPGAGEMVRLRARKVAGANEPVAFHDAARDREHETEMQVGGRLRNGDDRNTVTGILRAVAVATSIRSALPDMDVTALSFGFAVSTSRSTVSCKQRKEDVVLANGSAQHVLRQDASAVGIDVNVRQLREAAPARFRQWAASRISEGALNWPSSRQGHHRQLRIGGGNIGFGQPQFLAHDIGAANQRDHLVIRVHAAHRLAAEAAVARQDQPLRLDVFERAADEVGDFLWPLDLQRAMADDAERDLLVLGDHRAEVLEVHATVERAFDREHVAVELVEIGQSRLVGLILAGDALRRRTRPSRCGTTPRICRAGPSLRR